MAEESYQSQFVSNPFIKLRNRDWQIAQPPSGSDLSASLNAISGSRVEKEPQEPPPPKSLQSIVPTVQQTDESVVPDNERRTTPAAQPKTAAVEAGETQVQDHVQYFAAVLAKHVRTTSRSYQLSIPSFIELYERHQQPHGHHFVIHQHDHPVAGVHYDLRLQISRTSSISFACMYGLPGDPVSKRLNRNATETRVHNLWNHLIETASHNTGSLLIWDTGYYEILHRRSKHDPAIDPDSASEARSDSEGPAMPKTEPEKLAAAFSNRKIKLRLHGTKLPGAYTLNLRLTKAENRTEQPKRPVRKRRRVGSTKSQKILEETPPSSDNEGTSVGTEERETVLSQPKHADSDSATTAIEKELEEQEDEMVRRTNAYPGATNSIGSIHQRKWYLSLDRAASGFTKTSKNGKSQWERARGVDGKLLGFDAFHVHGRDEEMSVVTGRTADDIMADEGVVGYIGRKGWRPVLE